VWRDYVAWCLELRTDASGARAFHGRTGAVSTLLKATLDTLPSGVRARLLGGADGSDLVKGVLDDAGASEEELAHAAAAMAAHRGGLTSDLQAVLEASGAGIPDASGLARLPLDSSAGLLSGAARVEGGPAADEAAGGTSLPRPIVRQYYPRTVPVYAPDGVTVLRHRPVVTRLAEDLAGVGLTATGLYGRPGVNTPDAPWAGDEADAGVLDGLLSRSLGVLAGESAAGDIVGDMAAHRRAVARARLSPEDRKLLEQAEAEQAAESAARTRGGSGGGGGSGAAAAAGAAGGKGAFDAAARASQVRRAAEADDVVASDFGGGDDDAAGAAELALAEVPKPVTPATLAAHEADLASGASGVASEPSPRVKPRGRRARRQHAATELKALIDEAASREVPPSELLDEARPWTHFGYAPAANYREPGSYTVLHERLLEAADARDLEAMFALWHEHTRMAPQVRARARGCGCVRERGGARACLQFAGSC
jgi:hypothetical protein